MGAGGSLEAGIAWSEKIPAGTWHIVGDGLVYGSCDVTFDVIFRQVVSGQAVDHEIASFTHHFDPAPADAGPTHLAVAYDGDAPGMAVPAGDSSSSLVLRISVQGDPGVSIDYQPNGDGPSQHARLPYLVYP